MIVKKETIIKIFVILIVLAFITEMFKWFGPGWQTSPITSNIGQDQTLSGLSVFNGTLTTYKPYLFVKGEVNKTVEDLIKTDKRVESVFKSSEGVVVSIKQAEDVFDVYTSLKSMNVVTFADAEINLPYILEVNLSNGTLINISGSGIIINNRMEPFAKPPTTLKVKMIAIAKNGIVVGYQSLSILPEPRQFYFNGTIKEIYSNVFLYHIPWESRNEIKTEDLRSKYGVNNVNYSINNYISFKRDLNAFEIQEKKNKTYVLAITEKTATIVQNMTNKETIVTDFGDLTNFPESMLKIETNETPQLDYSVEKTYYYTTEIDPNSYSLPTVLKVWSNATYYPGNQVTVSIYGLMLGQQLINIEIAKIS